MSDIDYVLENYFKQHSPFDDYKLASLKLQAELLFKGYEIVPIDWNAKAPELEDYE